MGRSSRKAKKVIDDAEVKVATGKTWKEWFALLDEFGVEERGHDLTVHYLREHHKLPANWAKEVALHYENDRGLRSLIA